MRQYRSIIAKFIYDPGIDEPICMIVPSGANAGMYWYHFDALGSVVALSQFDTTQAAIVEAYSYSAFGQPTVHTDDGADDIWLTGDDTLASTPESGFDNPYTFTGRQWDSETGLYYYRARMYSPALGRFLQTDPIGYADSMNLYTYCGNNPLNWIDPWGLFRFGKRDLRDTFSGSRYLHLLPIVGGPIAGPIVFNIIDAGLYHEEGFFEDGSHENVGYFGPVNDPLNPGTKKYVGVVLGQNYPVGRENPSEYDIEPWVYDDAIMRQAITNVNISGQFDPQNYKVVGTGKNNCQDYASALRKEYKRLGGTVKFRPFGRIKKF